MLLSFVTFIIIITVWTTWILQVSDSTIVNEHQQFHHSQNKRSLSKSERTLGNDRESRNDEEYDEAKVFESIQEITLPPPSAKGSTVAGVNNQAEDFSDLKGILQKLLEKLNNMDRSKKDNKNKVVVSAESQGRDSRKAKTNKSPARLPRWGEWTPWSACSVSCGKGREIRWRHCVEDCNVAETEMEEKTCQLPACGPGKIFGIQL